MVRWLILLVLLTVFGAPAHAAPPVACSTLTTLQDYKDAGSCAVGKLIFANFDAHGGYFLGDEPAPNLYTDIYVEVIDARSLDPGLRFLCSLCKGIKDDVFVATIDYIVGGRGIKGASLQVIAAHGDGAGYLRETLDGTGTGELETMNVDFRGREPCRRCYKSVRFRPVLHLDVADRMQIAGEETLTEFQNNFALVPEPDSWTLLILGAGLLGWAGRRARARLDEADASSAPGFHG